MPKKTLPVLINRAGGAAANAGEDLADQVRDAFVKAGADVSVSMLDGGDLGAELDRVSSQPRVVVAGGDGTAACAAGVLAGSEAEMALLPLGTLNHLARDLGIPDALEDAAALAAKGVASPIDVGRVNGQLFVNNASIGLYPFMVRQRDEYREHKGWPKWLASIPASWEALSRLPHHRLRIDLGRGEQPLVTPLLFVGNNLYSLESGTVGSRASLSDGLLSVYAVARRSRLSLLWFGIRAMLGRVDRSSDFIALGQCASLVVRSQSHWIDVGLDGEIRRMQFPLEFSIDAGALKIVGPSPEPVAHPS